MTWLLAVMVAAQGAADGFGMNVTTLGVVTAVVIALVGALTFLWRYATSRETRYIDRLERENDELKEALIDSLRQAHHSTDVADDAAKELLKRRTKRPT